MHLIEFLKNNGIEELMLPLITTSANFSFKLTLDYPGYMTATLTPDETMKFLHMLSTTDGEKVTISASTQEEIEFLEQAFNWLDAGQFQLGSKYAVKDFGLFIGI